MGKLVKTATDMVSKYTGAMDPTRVGGRYDAAKEEALNKYPARAGKYRDLIEKARKILSQEGVPSGLWGVHIAFVLKLAKAAEAYTTKPPAQVIEGFKSEYTLKGADPAVLDILANIIG